MDISKKDWKLFRERLSGWQENYMEGLVKEYANFLNDDKKPASEKFWELEKPSCFRYNRFEDNDTCCGKNTHDPEAKSLRLLKKCRKCKFFKQQ